VQVLEGSQKREQQISIGSSGIACTQRERLQVVVCGPAAFGASKHANTQMQTAAISAHRQTGQSQNPPGPGSAPRLVGIPCVRKVTGSWKTILFPRTGADSACPIRPARP